MNGNTRFWMLLAVFQIAFGLSVFALTRQHYMHDAAPISAGATRQSAAEWPVQSKEGELANLISAFPGPATVDDPVALSFQADEAFSNQQFSQAAQLYERLLLADPGNADTYNNLGLTLHYLGRSTEALSVLNEGVAVDPSYQRIWLTLGYVNSQLGNLEQAREALTAAVEMGADTDVGQSASHMLDAL
jgi:tetratricopeptide (TPR) repeat protein